MDKSVEDCGSPAKHRFPQKSYRIFHFSLSKKNPQGNMDSDEIGIVKLVSSVCVGGVVSFLVRPAQLGC